MSYIPKHRTPSEERQHEPRGETLREKVFKKIKGKDANPSQLGDPISIKAETSSTIPTDEDRGSQTSGRAIEDSSGYGPKNGRGEKRRVKAAREVHGEGANPTMLGDPISGKAETSDLIPTEAEQGAGPSRGSRL